VISSEELVTELKALHSFENQSSDRSPDQHYSPQTRRWHVMPGLCKWLTTAKHDVRMPSSSLPLSIDEDLVSHKVTAELEELLQSRPFVSLLLLADLSRKSC